jgi:hypothetical protein
LEEGEFLLVGKSSLDPGEFPLFGSLEIPTRIRDEQACRIEFTRKLR